MENFTQRRKFTTRKPMLVVDAGLAPGGYVFELVVTDSAGNSSKAARVKVTIERKMSYQTHLCIEKHE